jgi:hypothetical protein
VSEGELREAMVMDVDHRHSVQKKFRFELFILKEMKTHFKYGFE